MRQWCLVAGLALATLWGTHAASAAKGSEAGSIPNAPSCVATTFRTGKPVAARVRVGESGYTAYASYDPDGWPAITYASGYFQLPAVVQTFLSLHECGHLVLKTSNEFRANCYALEQGRWTRAELEVIAASHRAVGRIGPQYGGSGAAFWKGTELTCPQHFE